MPVSIDIDVRAADAVGEIGAIAGALEGLDAVADDVDFDLDLDIDGTLEHVENLMDALDDLEFEVDGLADGLEDAVDQLDGVTLDIADPDGTTGSGDGGGTDPPEFDSTRAARRIESRFDLEPGSIDADTIDGMEVNEINAHVEDFMFRRKGIGPDSPARNFGLDWGGFDRDIEPFTEDDFDFEMRRGLVEQMRTGAGFQAMRSAQGGSVKPDMDLREIVQVEPGGGGGGLSGVATRRFRNAVAGAPEDADLGGLSRLGRALKRAKPSMRFWYNILAAVIPLLITFAVQAGGVATALLGVTGAGAALIGLGLVGHGEDMASSWENAKEQLGDLKEELFEVFQPTMQEFAPIQAEFFDWAPGRMSSFADELQNLTRYSETVFAAFGGGIDWMERIARWFAENEEQVSQMALTFGSLLGNSIFDFFAFLFNEGEKNQQMLIRLGGAMKDLGLVLYNVSKFLSRIIVTLAPLLSLIADASQLLDNRLIAQFLALMAVWGGFIGLAYKVTTALYAVAVALGTVGGSGVVSTVVGGIARITGMLYGLIAAAWEANVALGVLASLATLGLAAGAAVVTAGIMSDMADQHTGGGAPPGAPQGNPAGGAGATVINDQRTYEINTQGEMDYATENRVRDTIQEEDQRDQMREPPSPKQTGSGDSDRPQSGNNSTDS